MRIVLVLILSLTGNLAMAQDTLFLDERSYLSMVWHNAPVIRSRLLANDVAQQYLLETKGAFQPKLSGMYQRKQFDNTLYYSRSTSEISIQTPAAVRLSGGLNTSSGVFLNPESRLPSDGLTFVSLELPLGAGLLTDKNRTGVKLARLNLSSTELEVLLEVNTILFEAGKTYWKWYESILMRNLALEAQRVTQERFEFVKAKERIGEYATIDTLEAYINLQNREAFYNEQRILWEMRSRELATALAIDSPPRMAPVVDPDVKPLILDTSWSADLLATHPVNRMFALQQMSNEARERLAREYFKPVVNLQYSIQQAATDPFMTDYRLDENQYLGMQFSFPIFLRSERASAKQWAIRNEILQFEQQNFNIDLKNTVSANVAIRNTLDSNQLLWRSNAANYARLLAAEQQRFALGESNNFLLNRREIQWLEARKKYIQSYVEYRIRTLEYYYLLALLPEVVRLD